MHERSASHIAKARLEGFNDALRARNTNQLQALFHTDSHWRDLLALTWQFGTVTGSPDLTSQLLTAASRMDARDFEIDPNRCAPTDVERAGEPVVEAMLRFKTSVGEGNGLVRIRRSDIEGDEIRAWTLLT